MCQSKPSPEPNPNLDPEQPSDLRELEDDDWPAAIKPLHLKKIRAAAAKLEVMPTAAAEVKGAEMAGEAGAEAEAAGEERSAAAEAEAAEAQAGGVGADVGGGGDDDDDDDFFGEMDRGKKAAKEAAKAKRKGRQASLAPTQAWRAGHLSSTQTLTQPKLSPMLGRQAAHGAGSMTSAKQSAAAKAGAAAANAAAKAGGGRGTARQGGGGKSGGEVDELTCKVCGMACASRNQLFKHIQQTGHAAFK